MRQRARAGLGAVATGVALVLLTGTASAAPSPGASGVGDPYYPRDGNGGYDVSHYDLRLTYQPATDRLSGTTTILATTTQELSRFNLDFALKVNSVRVNNYPAKFASDPQAPGELVVTPAIPLRAKQPITVVVNYADTPSTVKVDNATAWKRTADGALAVNEPHVSRWWYPSNDHPTDKATFDVSVEVPNSVAALSNGTLVRKSSDRAGWTRWQWRSTQPQATYLTSLEVGAFEVNTSTTPSGQPFITAYHPALGASLPAAKASVERSAEVVEFLETQFGPYPFEAQGGVVTNDIGFALENQTRPVYGNSFFRGGANTSVVAHELGHQWWGDSVSVGKWSEIWLNEGFASYAEFLWSEHQGEGTADELAQYIYDQYPAEDRFWQTVVADPGADKQFDGAVYDRGALAVHALRKAVGDDSFFRILKTWQAKKKGSTGLITEFVALAEKVSGKPLGELFQTWLYQKGKPAASPNGAPAAAPELAHARTKRSLSVQPQPKSYPAIKLTHDELAKQHQR